MAEIHLNIVSFDVPFPPDYGGVMDVFYKIKALHSLNVKIHLHCFEYSNRKAKDELLKYCEEVSYYKRRIGILSNLSHIPYIIFSRRDKDLYKNLEKNKYPILFEGLHTTYYLVKGKLTTKKILLRSHNIEHEYYTFLAKQEGNFLKKLFFFKESLLLKRVLKKLPEILTVGVISIADQKKMDIFLKNSFWLPAFHSNDKVLSKIGYGTYVLYHGNLSVSENETAALFLIRQFKNKPVNLIITGKSPTLTIRKSLKNIKNIRLVSNPQNSEMDDLIMNAHAILLPTFQSTGIKLKLLESLFKGRFVIANNSMVKNTFLEDLTVNAEIDFYEVTKTILKKEFSQSEIEIRKKILNEYYDNKGNAIKLVQRIRNL